MSDTYLKPSQTSKMKLLAKVVNASRDVFRTVFSIQNVFRTYSEHLRWSFFKYNERLKAVNFSAKSSMVDILLGLEIPLDSQSLTAFTKNCILGL